MKKEELKNEPIRKGDRVRIRPEWQDEGDEEFSWIATEDEDGGRVSISPLNSGLSIPPVQRVTTEMIERVAPDEDDARLILAKLTPEQKAYAADPARGEYRGFAALHDLMDANMLLPEPPTLPSGDVDEAYVEADIDRCNRIMEAMNKLLLADGGGAK
jgi:hypothetical protein